MYYPIFNDVRKACQIEGLVTRSIYIRRYAFVGSNLIFTLSDSLSGLNPLDVQILDRRHFSYNDAERNP